MDMLGLCCSVRKLLWCRNIIVVDADFNESCTDVSFITFIVFCLSAKKVFR